MGGAVSSGQDNDELVDNLLEASYIKSQNVEQVFRIVDRAHYYLTEFKHSAYKDLAWKSGTLHLSAPCIYSEVMEALELKPGLSFLNLGSGTGYLNTMVGYVIGPYGINHGVELHEDNVTYAQEKLESFKETCRKFDDLELGEPQFVVGNCLNLAPENRLYDRVYCGAGCPTEEKEFIQGLVKIGGILVVPVGDQLLKIRRESETEYSSDNVLPVSFASLVLPLKNKEYEPIILPEVNPLSLQCICRMSVRDAIRKTFNFEQRTEDAESVIRASKSRSRILKHIRPTPEGLVIMRSDSDLEDHPDGDDHDDDDSDDEIPEEQLQIHVQDLIRWGQRFTGFESGHNIEDVDSDLSDMEELSDKREDNDNDKPTPNSNSSKSEEGPSSTVDALQRIPEAMESEEDWDTADDDEREKGKMEHSLVYEEEVASKESQEAKAPEEPAREEKFESRNKTESVSSNTPVHPFLAEEKAGAGNDGIEDSLSSEEDEEDSQVLGVRMPISQISALSQPRTIKTSYSTSADTSETSGFGSLGEEIPALGSQLSTDGSLKDDLSDSMPELSKSEKESDVFMSGSPGLAQTLEEGENLAQESSTDAEWVHMQDEDDSDDSDSDVERKSRTKFVRPPPGFFEGIDSDVEDEEEVKERPPRGPDFTAFLKEKVDTLPIPSTLKAFILHYR